MCFISNVTPNFDFLPQDRVFSEDSEKSAKRISALHEECTELKTKNEELEQENNLLQQGLKEIKEQREQLFAICFVVFSVFCCLVLLCHLKLVTSDQI